MKSCVIAAACRTPLGRFGGAFAGLGAPRLGGVVLEELLRRAPLPAQRVDEVILGQVLTAGAGQAPARQAARHAGYPDSVPCTTINKVCGSGLKAVMMGFESIRSGESEVVVAGGMESMSDVPYFVPGARSGLRLGHGSLVDGMIADGLWDPTDQVHMGTFGDRYAESHGITREQQDTYAIESYERALQAQRSGWFQKEIVTTLSASPRGKRTPVAEDEEPSRFDGEKFRKLPPVFGKTITAGNASKLNDGAAALLLMDEQVARRAEVAVMAHVRAHGTYGGPRGDFSEAPARAIEKVVQKAGLTLDDIDVFEINEAFAVVPLVCMQQLGVPRDRVNPWGGAIALGHPIGCSGARILVTLLSILERTQKRFGCATLCLGGGEAVAMVVERAP